MKETVLKMTGIDKNFPGVKALSGVEFELRKGEIHALMGENGAGKSTLIKVLTGVYEKDSGEIYLNEATTAVSFDSPKAAQTSGIQTVYQEINLLPNLSVAENLFLDREPRKWGMIDWKKMNALAAELLKKLDIKIDAHKQLSDCSIGIQQMIAIARAVDMECQVLILDEPTSSLDDDEVKKLFRLMTALKERGVGIVFVTHFLEQVYEISDRITVLRNGELVGAYDTKELPRPELVAKMMGKDIDDLARIKAEGQAVQDVISSHTLLEARGLYSTGSIKPFDLTLHPHEVIGITGLLGSGRSELVRTIFGADSQDGGKLLMKNQELTFKAPINAMKRGIAYLPEDRKKDGIFQDLSVRENIIIALQTKQGIFQQISRKETEAFADRYIDLLQIKTASRETPIKQLSGGNQQKVIIGRWLLTEPELLILDEPTRGIDVGTKTEIQKLMIDLAAKGMSIIFISSEIEEMIRTCSRMIVMRDGEKVGELSDQQLDQETIIWTIAGGVKQHGKS
ncbi:sugar ABC transporter ATP-binding protein [Fundicoccus sp. Sow4_F4]|uniref:sugar ABC transporter ATP-binding protein n=1 Tax=Fundicoccus sp. Sow4_F4 TaxID=3438783 RepID=UPI003F8DA5D9